MEFEVILPVHLLPDGTRVRKPTGEKIYVVKRKIEIYGANHQSINCEGGMIFLVAERGSSINAISEDKKVVAFLTIYQLENLFESDK